MTTKPAHEFYPSAGVDRDGRKLVDFHGFAMHADVFDRIDADWDKVFGVDASPAPKTD